MDLVATDALLDRVRACDICATKLPHGVRPVLQLHPDARILIAGQAPGRKVHDSGVPFDDASGERLRQWMGIAPEVFYDPRQCAILPMGFCYPGRGKSGDLPPRPECAPAWRQALLDCLPNLSLSLLIGRYAQSYHLSAAKTSLTDTVAAWRRYAPRQIPLPHPSPRNNIWLKRNLWFEQEVVPELRGLVQRALSAKPAQDCRDPSRLAE